MQLQAVTCIHIFKYVVACCISCLRIYKCVYVRIRIHIFHAYVYVNMLPHLVL